MSNSRSNGAGAQFARMPWYPRDFASSTRGWPLVARAVYRELLDAQWDMSILPAEEEHLRELAGAKSAEWRVAWRYLEAKFPLSGGGRRNARLEAHRQAAIRKHEAHRKGAETTNQLRYGDGAHAD